MRWGLIVTQAETIEALREEVRDAVRCHFDEGQGPAVIRLHSDRNEVLRMGEKQSKISPCGKCWRIR